MAHAFKTISAKPTFGTLKENLYQSDYINRKKGIITVCNYPSRCQRIRVAPSYNTRNSFNIGRYALSLKNCNVLPVNKGNLIIGQYAKQNLKDICTVSPIDAIVQPEPCSSECNPCQNNGPVIIDPNSDLPFYQSYQIDPLGQLFGKSQCGELNYTHYMGFYPPTNPLTLAFS
jgi:hypothetical protein